MGLGPAEAAEASYATAGYSRRVLPKGCSFGLVLQHGLARKGAGRIEPAERYTASPQLGIKPAFCIRRQGGI